MTPKTSQKELWFALGCTVLVHVLFTFFAYYLLVYNGLFTSAYDLGIIHSVIWNIVNEGKPYTSLLPPYYKDMNRFGFHFEPIIYLLVPFYQLFNSPLVFNAVGSVCFALTAVPIYLTMRALGKSTAQSYIWALIYLMSPFVLNATIFDFKQIAFAPLFMATAMYAIISARFKLMLAACALLLLTKEHYGLSVCAIGIAWWHFNARDRRGLIVAAIGLIVLFLILYVVMPYFSNSQNNTMVHYFKRHTWLNLSKPLETLDYLINSLLPRRVRYHAYLFGAFLPVLFYRRLNKKSLFILAIMSADYASNVLDKTNFQTSVFAYHTAPMIPIVIVAAALLVPPRAKYIPLLVLTITGYLNSYHSSQYLHYIMLDPVMIRLKGRSQIDDIQKLIPKDAAVGVQKNLIGYFANLDTPILFPNTFTPHMDKIDYVVLHVYNPLKRNSLHLFGNPFLLKRYQRVMNEMIEYASFEIAYDNNGWVLLKRSTDEEAIQYAGKRLAVLLEQMKK